MYNISMYTLKIFLFILIISTSLFSKENEKITIQLDWLHQFQFAGYYIAKEKGYFANENIDITIKEFSFGLDLVENVLTNKNIYSVGKSSLIIEKLNGKKISLINAIYHDSPLVLISLKNKKNNYPLQDLENKKVMLTTDAISSASIISMLKSQNVQFDKINFIPHSFKLEDLILGNTDAMGSYLSNEPYILSKKNIKFNIFNPKDYGFNFYGGLLFTSEDEVNNNLNRVKKINQAALKGWSYAFENIEETARIIFKKYNTQNKSLEALIYEGLVLKKLSKYTSGLLGNISEDKIHELKRLYLLLGLVKKDSQNSTLDNFIFRDEVHLNKEEQSFIKTNHFILNTSSENTPFSFKNNSLIEGIEIDILNSFKNSTNLNSEIQTDRINRPKSNKNKFFTFEYDKSNFDHTKNIQSKVIHTVPLALATTNNKNLITDLSMLEKKTILVINNNDIFKKLTKEFPSVNFKKEDSIKKAFNLLKNDRVFAVIDDTLTLSHYIIKNNFNNIKLSGTLPFQKEIRISTSKDNHILINIINKLIKGLDEKEKALFLKKYQLILYQKITDYSWLYKFLLPLLVLLAIIIRINSKLRIEIKQKKIAQQELLEYANTDKLTKIFNRGKIESLLISEIKRSKRFNSTFSIIFMDIDDFKQINDELGHLEGDKVLCSIAKTISKNIRESDFFGRWGGEEFIIILPQTNARQAHHLALSLKETLSKKSADLNKDVTLSFGITEYLSSDTKRDLVKRADEAMYSVKRSGKNNIRIL